MSTGSVVCGDVTSSGTVSAPQLFASNTLTVVRKGCLYYPINFRIWVAKPCKTAKFFNPLNVFPMSPVNVTAPFLVQKALKTANSEKCVFLCPASKVQPGPPNLLVFRRQVFAVLRNPYSASKNLRIPPAEVLPSNTSARRGFST